MPCRFKRSSWLEISPRVDCGRVRQLRPVRAGDNRPGLDYDDPAPALSGTR
jgi:hypothetical protein